MVFDGVVCTPFKSFRYLCPFIFLLSVLEIKDEFLFQSPCRLFNTWIKMIMPSFAARLALFPWKMVCNLGPFLRTQLVYKVYQLIILLGCPVTVQLVSFSNGSILDLAPSIKTLLVSSAFDVLSNFHPVAFAELFYRCNEPLIFLLCPISASTT